MSKVETNVSTLKINRGTYANIVTNLASIGENELIITTDKNIPIPAAGDSGKVISVNAQGDYELTQQIKVNSIGGASGIITLGSGLVMDNNTLSTTPENPMTAQGDIIIGGTSGAMTRLANGSAGQILTSNGTAPTWSYIPCFIGNPASDPQIPEGQIAFCKVTSEPATRYDNIVYIVASASDNLI